MQAVSGTGQYAVRCRFQGPRETLAQWGQGTQGPRGKKGLWTSGHTSHRWDELRVGFLPVCLLLAQSPSAHVQIPKGRFFGSILGPAPPWTQQPRPGRAGGVAQSQLCRLAASLD